MISKLYFTRVVCGCSKFVVLTLLFLSCSTYEQVVRSLRIMESSVDTLVQNKPGGHYISIEEGVNNLHVQHEI